MRHPRSLVKRVISAGVFAGTVLVAGVVLPAVSAVAAPVDAGARMVEFDLGNPNGLPSGIVAADDGGVWVSVFGDRTVLHLSSEGNIIGTFPLTGAPSSLTSDHQGGVWAAEIGFDRIAHIGYGGNKNEYVVPTKFSLPSRIWDGGDQVYFTEQGTGSVGRFTESTEMFDEWTIPGAKELGAISGLDDQVWVADPGAGTIWILDRSGLVKDDWSNLPHLRDFQLNSQDVATGKVHGTFAEADWSGSFDYPGGSRGNVSDRTDIRGYVRVNDRTWVADAATNSIYTASAYGESEFSIPNPDAGLDGLVMTESRFLWTLERKQGKVARLDMLAAVSAERIGGADRYELAANISRSRVPSSDTVFIASGEKFADALSASAVAGRLKSPVLLTAQASLPDAVRRELIRRDPSRVVVVGGPASVSDVVIESIRHELPDATSVERVGGADRFAVSRALLTGTDAPTAHSMLYVANGGDFADALSSSPAAAVAGTGVLLVNGKSPTLSADEMTIIKEYSSAGGTIKIAGGPLSVSVGIEAQIAAVGSVVRFGGADRFAVSKAINDDMFPDSHAAFLASGTTFPDALTGGPAAAIAKAPLYLVHPDCIPGDVIGRLATGGEKTWLLGGENTLSPAVLALKQCGP